MGCGAAAILILIAGSIFLAYTRRHPWVLTDVMMASVERSLSSDVSDAERTELKNAYAAFRQRLGRGPVSPRAVDHLRSALFSVRRGPIGREQVAEIIGALREALESGPPPSAEPLAPTPRPTAAAP